MANQGSRDGRRDFIKDQFLIHVCYSNERNIVLNDLFELLQLS